MYLKEIYLENTGPISKCRIELPFNNDGNPLPVVIVGPNGSGKSIFLSYIVDALTEFAKQAFSDIVRSDGLNDPYFRIISRTAIKSGQPFSLSLLRFKADDDLYYCEKSGELDPTNYSPTVKSVFHPVWKWPTEGNYKLVATDKEDDWSVDEIHGIVSPSGRIVKTEMQTGVYAFFPASRHEYPVWLNPRSLKVNMEVPANSRFSTELDKPIWVETCAEENIPWILDVFLDSLIDLVPGLQLAEGQNLVYRNVSSSEMVELKNRSLLRRTRENVESILQEILQDGTAKLNLGYRNIGPSRISIKLKEGLTIPTLQSLSGGQSQLLHLFATIIRYGERTDLNRSIHLRDITGLVLIDEIDAHLHPSLQHSVVPKLVKLFPKVQFVVSSHSPLFLLGMEKEFGSDGLAILELPDGDRISSEEYPEFRSVFEYYQDTERFEDKMKQRFGNMTKPIVLTEGKTDAQYIQTALELLGEEELLNSLEIKPVGNDTDKELLPGGTTGLDAFRKTYATHPSYFHHPMLLLYDCDAKSIPEPIERLWVRSIPPNNENTKVKKGIENLFPKKYFEGKFKKEYYNRKPKDDGGHSENLDKPRFCEWICKHGSAADFEKFDCVVEILKEFIEAHQSQLD